MKAIFGGSGTVVTAVGDDKQKIMGWAGAQNDNFGVFKKDFLSGGAGAQQQHLTLSLNYRSNARIVEILNALKRKLAPDEPDFRPVRPAPSLPPEKICAVIVSPDRQSEAEALGTFVGAEIAAGLSPRKIGLLVRQKASDWEKRLGPVFQQHHVRLRNEDRDVGGASIQDLMTETYAQTVVDGLELLLHARGGAIWARCIEALSEMEGLLVEEDPERVRELTETLDNFHQTHRIGDSDAAVTPEDLLKRLERVESFIGVPRLRASAPQYQQGDFFERVRAATRTFLKECCAGDASWKVALSRYRGEDQVPLMTITKSKGLEYDLVVLLGLDDNDWWSFPKNPAEGHSTFFVAASRARERLFMTLCRGNPTSKVREIYEALKEAGVKGIKSESLLGSPAS